MAASLSSIGLFLSFDSLRGISPPAGGGAGFRPAGRVSFWMPRKKPKRHQGAAQDERFALIFAAPGPHLRGLPLGMGKNFRRAKFEWLFAIPSGPLGPGFTKNSRFCGSISAPGFAEPTLPVRIDGGRMICAPTGFRWTVGAAISRPKAFSLPGRRCRAYARRMRVGQERQKPLSGPASVRPLRKGRRPMHTP